MAMKIEGPGMWRSMEALAELHFNDPENFKYNIIGIFRKISCSSCARDSFVYLENNYPEDPITWICDFHNHVNLKIGSPKFRCPKRHVLKAGIVNKFSHTTL